MAYVAYVSNNSQGSWWLGRDDWEALEKAGWRVHWAWLNIEGEEESGIPKLVHCGDEKRRFVGAVARQAYFDTNDVDKARESWENALSKSSYEGFCTCCGSAHNFYLEDGVSCYGPSKNE